MNQLEEKLLDKYKKIFIEYFSCTEMEKRNARLFEMVDSNFKKHSHLFKEGIYPRLPDKKLYRFRVAWFSFEELFKNKTIEEPVGIEFLDNIFNEIERLKEQKKSSEQLDLFT